MKASVRWLRELCPALPDDPGALAARLTAAGIAVDAVQPFGLATEACVVARVVSARPHPSRSGLRLVTVQGAAAAPQEVVCGAPNVPEAGGLVVLAPLGAHLPAKGLTIERRSIAGVPSEGMLCSEAELGLGDEAAGILVLSGVDAAPGTPLARAVPGARDDILEIDLTPNRADALGHLGLAREAAAMFDVPFAPAEPAPPAATRDDALASYVSVAIEDAERCAHYGAAVLVDATIAPSPLDLRWRLASMGVRAISNVVDVTNLVMLELGHPTHAFDLDKVRGGKIVVRRAAEGEKLTTLDGVARTLTADDLVICDEGGPVALAGVMGGGDSEISADSRRILLECAWFDPRAVRRAARRHGLHTESSHRFERGVDWGDTARALARASELVARLSGATAVRETRVFEARAQARRTVALRPERLRALLGVDVAADEASATLARLGFVRLPSGQWQVPSFRPDVAREVDLVEEVGRVRGYDGIPTTVPAVRPSRDEAPVQSFARRAREAAISMGLSEAVTFAFVSPRELAAVGAPPARVVLKNPLNEAQSVMRTSLLPGLLRALAHARRHGERDARLFTVGTLFLEGPKADEGPGATERSAFAAVLAGHRDAWLAKPEPFGVWDGKGLARGLVARLLRRDADVKLVAPAAARPAHLHPRGAAWIDVDGQRVGALGPLHPDVVDALDLGDEAVVLELDLAALAVIGPREPRFAPLPRFPAATRDLAVVVRDDVPAGDVEHAVREAAGDLAERVRLFDRFAGGAIPAGHASLAVHVVYRAPDRTLTDAEVDARHAQVLAAVQKRFGALLRA